MHKYIILVSIVILLSSCFKEDEKIAPHNPGNVSTVIIPLTRYYSNQVYYNLEKEEIVSVNTRSIFDLNFSCADTSSVIKLNTANFAMAAETMYDKMEDVTDTTGLEWHFDTSDGNLDSLAITNWIQITDGDTLYSNKVWVINRGVSSMGIPLGLTKIQFNGLILGNYNFTYSNLDNSNRVEASVQKNNSYSYAQYSFSEKKVEQTEPKINDWDLLFTTYSTMLITDEGDLYPYLLTGVLQNQSITSVAMDSTIVFENIVLADTVNFIFSNKLDKIGYDWKKLIGDVNTGNIYYEIKIEYSYIIRDNNLFYYKLRFINFYDPLTGEKGYPTFEYQKL